MEIARGEKLLLARSDPAVPRGGLTLGAMAIATAVIGDGGTMSAAHALIEMTAESGGTTTPNGPQYFHVLPTEPMAGLFDENPSRSPGRFRPPPRGPGPLIFLQRPFLPCLRKPRDPRGGWGL